MKDLMWMTKQAIVGKLFQIFPKSRVYELSAISWKDDGDNTALIDGERHDILCFVYFKGLGCLMAVGDEMHKEETKYEH